MKLAGIIGGIAPGSTVDYYQRIVASYLERAGETRYPALVINCIDLRRMLAFFEANDRAGAVGFLLGEVERLARAGADFGVLASNTPHLVFDEIQRESPLPLISIVEATRDAAEGLGLTRVGLLGTRFAMQGGFYERVFSGRGIAVVTPAPEEQASIHAKYMDELVRGRFLPETREQVQAIVARLVERERIQGLILGGTELPLLLRDGPDLGVPLLDTTQIHVERIVAAMLSESVGAR
jgi:aspartate racemase